MKITTLLLFIALFNNGLAQEIYVSTSGSDHNPGTVEKPVATLHAARDLVRHYNSLEDFPKSGYTVWIEGGSYNLKESLILNENDSGSPEANITWRAVEGADVRVTGGKPIPGDKFERVTDENILERLTDEASKNVVAVNLNKLGINNFGEIRQYGHGYPVTPAPLELFFNDKAMTLSRYPNEGYLKIGNVIEKGSVPRIGDYSNKGGIFEYTDPRHEKWAGQEDIWLQGSFMYGFADDNIPVESIDTDKNQIKLAAPSFYGVGSGRDYRHYVAYNILEELDSPGEWYLDRKTGIMYFWPPENLKNSRIMVSILEDPLLSLEGCSNVTFRDITFEVGRGIGIYIERGSHNIIAGCTVRNVGTSGIFMGMGAKQTFPNTTHDDYVGVPVSGRIGNLQGHIYHHTGWDRNSGTNHKILSSDVYGTGSGGIVLSGGNKRKLIPGNNVVENCRIYDYNRRNKFLFSGINVDGCGNTVKNCEIFGSEWQGIYVHGNEHIFEYNEIHHVTLNSDDTSPWYIGRDPSDRGNIIRYNYFHHIGNPDRMNMGIYCDDSSTGVEVYGNVFYKMNTKHGILFTNSGWDLKLYNNIIVEPLASIMQISAHYYTWAKGSGENMFGENGLLRKRLTENVNIYEPPYSEKYPELLEYLDPVEEGIWEGMISRRNELYRNLIVGAGNEILSLLGGEHANGTAFNNYQTDKDPGFVDYENENFNLKTNSKVYKKIEGFEPVPFDKMGLYEDEYRTIIVR